MSDESFTEQLRTDAARQAPKFSDARHARLMSAVRQAAKEERLPAQRSRWDRFLPLAVAAALAVALIGVNLLKPANPASGNASSENALASLDAIGAIQRSASDLHAGFESAQYAYLDQDVQQLAEFLMVVVPSTPAPQ